MQALLCQSVKAVEGEEGERIDVSLKQMGLDLCLKTDQKQKIFCYIQSIPFTVFPTRNIFFLEKAARHLADEANCQAFKRRNHLSSQLHRQSSTRAQQAVRAVFPPFAFPGCFNPQQQGNVVNLIKKKQTKQKVNFQSQNYLL